MGTRRNKARVQQISTPKIDRIFIGISDLQQIGASIYFLNARKDKRPTFSEEYLETQLLDLEDHLKSEDPNLARDLEQHTIHFSLAEKLQHQASFVKTSISETFTARKPEGGY